MLREEYWRHGEEKQYLNSELGLPLRTLTEMYRKK